MGKTFELSNEVLNRVEARLTELNEVLMSDVASDYTIHRVTLVCDTGEYTLYTLHTYALDTFDAWCSVHDELKSKEFIQVKADRAGLCYVRCDCVKEVFVEA